MKFLACFLLAACVACAAALPIHEEENDPNMWEKSGKFEGDILIHPSQVGKNGQQSTSGRWPSNTMYYTISSSFTASQTSNIQAAIDDYNRNTCVNMVQRTIQSDYVAIGNSDSGCYSYVGRIGGAQTLNLGAGCFTHGTIMHEMLHAWGFWHMQSTYDRDNYVLIHNENIQSGYESNFVKYSDAQVNDFGVSYDYGSVMHYDAYAFSSNGQKTIETIPVDVAIGQRVGLSTKDKTKLESMYGC